MLVHEVPDLDMSREIMMAYLHQEIFPACLENSKYPHLFEEYIKRHESMFVVGASVDADYKGTVTVFYCFNDELESVKSSIIPISYWMQSQASLELARDIEFQAIDIIAAA